MLVVCLSGRGDKDMETTAKYFGLLEGTSLTTTVRGVEEVLRRCRDEGRAALVGYLPVRFPTVEGSLEAVRAPSRPAATSSRSACPTATH